jgi:predicted nuclease of predicted toxin-antitoxin system
VPKLLFDNNISHRVLSRIEDIFPHSNHVMLESLDESSDERVWFFARSNNYAIVTKDSDFNDLAICKGTPPKIIWIKLGNCKVVEIENILRQNVDAIKNFLNEPNSAILEI